jgi:hypothetical protein
MPSADLRAALDESNRADRSAVRFQLLVAIPVALLGLGFADFLGLIFWMALRVSGVPVGVYTYLLFFNVLLAIIIVVDVKRHPHESWYQPRYRQSDGSVKGHELGDGRGDPLVTYYLERAKGPLFSGMPLMTRVMDPGNLAERGRVITSGFANLILGGPRSIAEALASRRRIRERSNRRTVSAAERFTAWLGSMGVVPEAEVKSHLEAHPDEVEGLALARELDVVARRRIQDGFHYHVR